jgi:Xaa-Pro aminopeptidase
MAAQQYLFPAEIYKSRRAGLKKHIGKGRLFFSGNEESPMNYTGNVYRFRQDSNFLYYFGLDIPGLSAIIDIDSDQTFLFGNELTIEDVVWMGPQESLKSLAERVGLRNLESPDKLSKYLHPEILYLPPYRHSNMINLANYVGRDIDQIRSGYSEAFTRAVVSQRSIKGPDEIEQMEDALATTASMHIEVMKKAAAGMFEADLAGIARGIAIKGHGDLSYQMILTQDGQIMHNNSYHNRLEKGRLLLCDFGAENRMHYAGDITRTIPVNPTFTTKQSEIYQIVLEAQEQCILSVRPGTTFREIHLQAAKIIAKGLKELGLMKGNVEEAVEHGAHALFFPHGLGHMIGLDVHDMEDLGEKYVGYDENVKRSDQFGFAYLRLARELQPGFVLTVEPGIYFIPELINTWKTEKKFTDFINYDRVLNYLDFSGIRIEDNVLVTEKGNKVLGPLIPKTIEEVEKLRA